MLWANGKGHRVQHTFDSKQTRSVLLLLDCFVVVVMTLEVVDVVLVVVQEMMELVVK